MSSYFTCKAIVFTIIFFVLPSVYAIGDDRHTEEQDSACLVYKLVRADMKIKEKDKQGLKDRLKDFLNTLKPEAAKLEFFSVHNKFNESSNTKKETLSNFLSYLVGIRVRKTFSWVTDLISILPSDYIKKYLLDFVRKTFDLGRLEYFKYMVKHYPLICDQDILTIFSHESSFYDSKKNSNSGVCKTWLKKYLAKQEALEAAEIADGLCNLKNSLEESEVAGSLCNLKELRLSVHDKGDIENFRFFIEQHLL